MATVVGHNIISPLGFSSMDTYDAIKSGKSSLKHYDSLPGIPFSITASLFDEAQIKDLMIDRFTLFESLAIRSIKEAIKGRTLDKDTILILSTTKGNIGNLKEDDNPDYVTYLGESAKRIADAIGINATPIVVSNACISGVSALILADRLIQNEQYKTAIVCGVDVQSPFIVSGFQSFKALSERECRPFDIERLGLNLGEAAATIILSANAKVNNWFIKNGAVRNDAFHLSSPSPKGDGSFASIQATLDGDDAADLALINAHGTATMYNDQMESKAISRAQLSDIPTNALKGYIGHTMGAAGIIESILTMLAVDDGIILATKGYEERGVSGMVNIVKSNIETTKSNFLKIISGFGGCNGAILFSKASGPHDKIPEATTSISHSVRITPESIDIDGKTKPVESKGNEILTEIYKSEIKDYPKFYKMDSLARLGFIATELLLKAECPEKVEDRSDRAIIFFNRAGSINADKAYLETISQPDNYFPSPSLFVYTLPNIVTGETAIRNKYRGETAFYILPEKDEALMTQITNTVFLDRKINSVITGWLDYNNDCDFEASIYLINKQ